MHTRRRRGEDGSGLIDVMIGFLIFAVVITLSATLMSDINQAGANVQANQQAVTTAESVIAQERAYGCGAVTGYGTAGAATALAQDCTFGANRVSSYSDFTGAAFDTGAFAEQINSNVAWGWSVGAPNCSGLSSGSPVTAPPNELTRTVVAQWRDHHVAGGLHSRTMSYTSAVPPVLAQGWMVGGLGAIAVQESQAGVASTLSVPGWPQPITAISQPGGCAWFPYVPAGNYTVTANGTPNTVAVAAGRWTVVG